MRSQLLVFLHSCHSRASLSSALLMAGNSKQKKHKNAQRLGPKAENGPRTGCSSGRCSWSTPGRIRIRKLIWRNEKQPTLIQGDFRQIMVVNHTQYTEKKNTQLSSDSSCFDIILGFGLGPQPQLFSSGMRSLSVCAAQRKGTA